MQEKKRKYGSVNRKKNARRARRLGAAGLTMGLLLGMGAQAEAATLKDIFDEKYYADTYADLKAAYGYDREALWQHFITFGLSEGRTMNGLLDVVKYRREYADLEAAFGDHWDAYLDHYLQFGAREGRNSGTAFNALDYGARYGDLKSVFGEDVLALWQHYRAYGAAESREARSEKAVEEERAARIAAEEANREQETAKPEETLKPEEPSKPQEPAENPGYSGYTKRVELNDGLYLINEYNFLNQLIKSTMYNSEDELVGWHINKYDAQGKLIEAAEYRPDGKQSALIELKYDADNKCVEKTSIFYSEDGSQSHKVREEYGADNKLVKKTGYDANNNVTGVTEYEDGKIVKGTDYKYDADGNMTEWGMSKYDAEGNWAEHERYDAAGNRIGRTVNEYDERGNRIKYTMYDANENATYAAEYSYEADQKYQPVGKLVKKVYYSYDAEGKGTGRCEMVYDDTGINVAETIYYDEEGNIIGKR